MTREVAIKAIQDFIGWFKEDSLIRKALDMAIQALSQEPCDDVISRDAVIKILEKYNLEMSKIAEDVSELPSVTHKSGKWHIAHGMYEDRFWCSCGYIRIMDSRMNEWKYCPVCGGAKMESEDK